MDVWIYVGNNSIYTANGTEVGICNVSMSEMQSHGYDLGSTVQKWGNSTQLLQQAKQLIFGGY